MEIWRNHWCIRNQWIGLKNLYSQKISTSAASTTLRLLEGPGGPDTSQGPSGIKAELKKNHLRQKNQSWQLRCCWRVLGGPVKVRDHQGSTLRAKGTVTAKEIFDLDWPSTATGGSLWPKFREANRFLRWAWPKLSFGTPLVGLHEAAHGMESHVEGFQI